MNATQANIIWRLATEERMKLEERPIKEARERAKRVAGLQDITLAEYEHALESITSEAKELSK